MTAPPPALRAPAPGTIAYLRVKVVGPHRDMFGERTLVEIVDRTGRPTSAAQHVVETHQVLSKERVLQ